MSTAGIGVVAPDQTVFEQVRSLEKSLNLHCRMTLSNIDQCLEAAQTLADEGIRVLVSRGSMADRIRESGLAAAVVEIPVTGYDMLAILEKAREVSRQVAVIGYDNVLEGARACERVLDMKLLCYRIYSIGDIEEGLRKAAEAGYDMVVGGARVALLAGRYQMRCIQVRAGMNSVKQALLEAKRLYEALRKERDSAARLAVTLDTIPEAIISFDNEARVLVSNAQANVTFDLKQRPQAFALQSGLDEAVRQHTRWDGEVRQWKGVNYVCNLNPVYSDARHIGSVALLQPTSHIHDLETKIRSSLRSKGHVAHYRFTDIIRTSPAMQEAVDTAMAFARSPVSTVLIQGESGTGKELFAQSIHQASQRHNEPFVAVNCMSIPASLLESELFGYAEGAFTGARKGGKAGLFELAHKGTLFLDEIGEIPPTLQSLLLRAIEEKTVMRIGQGTLIPVDVRIICASNKNLGALVRKGLFREDLYYRLNVLRLNIPPLRRHKEDIPLLVDHFLDTLAVAIGGVRPPLEPRMLEALLAHDYPGNVRELRNIVERMLVLFASPAGHGNSWQHLDAVMVDLPRNLPADPPTRSLPQGPAGLKVREERALISRVLAACGGNKSQAARELGISPSTLWRKCKTYGLPDVGAQRPR